MLNAVQQEIKQDKQIKKFCAYGFLKDLKFFDPYLLIFLMSKGLSLFQIGILISIREITINIFEIPSGFIADYFGRKKEMYFSFFFYIISFFFFFLTSSFLTAIIAMVLFGLGEAFRSGTHKAMIYTYLDKKGWRSEKTFVYGRTRSFSLIGNAFSSIIAIILILTVPSTNIIFLFSIIPYALDFILIITYPSFLDISDKKKNLTFSMLFKNFIKGFRKNKTLRQILIEGGIFDSTVSFVKDLIQPILELIIVGTGAVLLSSLTPEDNLNIILGIVYCVLNILGSFASKKAYIVKKGKTNIKCLSIMHIILTICLAILIFVSKSSILVFIVYLFIYALFNVRKPIFVDEIEEHIEKEQRSTIFSISSQLKSLFLMVLSPFLGFLADKYSFSAVMLVLSLIFVATLPLLINKKNKKGTIAKKG